MTGEIGGAQVTSQVRATCPICDRQGKQTAEDLMPLWVRKATLSLFPIDAADYPPRMTLRICHECNATMAARFENKASLLLAPMMKDRPATLRSRDQSIAARWFMKTTLLMNLADQLRSGVIRSDDREELRRMNADGEMPEGVAIRIGRYSAIEGDPDGTEAEIDRVVPGGYPRSVTHYSATTLGFVAFEMIRCATSDVADFFVRTSGSVRLVPIWPPNLSPVTWPPPETLTRADLGAMRSALTSIQGNPGYRRYFQPRNA